MRTGLIDRIKARIVPAELAHAEALAPSVIEDVRPSGYATALEALTAAVRNSERAYAAVMADGAVGAMFGVVPIEPGLGNAWFLMGRAMARRPREFVRVVRLALQRLSGGYRRLVSLASADWPAVVRFYARAGFCVHDSVRLGPAGHVYHRLTYEVP